MSDHRQSLGKTGEALALKFLKRRGYKILETNYRTRLGEIDIIAKQKKTIVFVEVKTRHTENYGNPKAAVTPQKQRKISMVALTYLKEVQKSDSKARFDVVAISNAGSQPQVELVQNAFELAYP
jgi:putative endonuclease